MITRCLRADPAYPEGGATWTLDEQVRRTEEGLADELREDIEDPDRRIGGRSPLSFGRLQDGREGRSRCWNAALVGCGRPPTTWQKARRVSA